MGFRGASAAIAFSLMACGGTGSTASSSIVPNPRAPSPEVVAEILGTERRVAMPIDGLPCEGPDDALVTVVESMGYQCPFSKALEPRLRSLLAEHEGEIRFCVRQFVVRDDQPFGLLAAHVALEAFAQGGPEMFFPLHRAMLAETLDPNRILTLALEAGLDEARLRDAVESNVHVPQLRADSRAVYRVDADGTPVLFVSGRVLGGAKPTEELAALFDAALIEARRLVDAGVRPVDLYATVQAGALTDVPRRQQHQGEPARVRIRFIDIGTSTHGLVDEPRTLDEARAIAQRLLLEIRAGADFNELARRWSNAANSVRGGEFGWIVRGTLNEETEDVAMALEVGETGMYCAEPVCRVIQRLE